MQLNRSLVASLAILVAVACCGCGGGSPPAKPGAAGQPGAAAPVNPAPGNAIQQQPVPAQVGMKGNTQPGTTTDIPEEEPIPAGPDDFEIDDKQTLTEIAGVYRDPLDQPLEALPLQPSFNSTTFEIVDPNATNNNPGSPDSAAPPAYAANVKPSPIPQNSNPASTATSTDEDGAWKLPEAATPVASAGTDPESGLPLRITLERDPVEMVLIPPGVFLEGVDGREANAAPQHSVLLESPYYIDVVEVTVERHREFREFYRKSEGRKLEQPVNHDGNPDAPAVGIKFLDAKFYARWTGKELPTEAQWERAARGPDGHEFPWGNGRPIFHQARHPGQLDPVGTYPGDLSPFGVYDMAGNAREWCLDLYSPDTFQKQAAAGGGPVRNPTGPKTFQGPRLQVVKGGKSDWSVWHRAGIAQNEAPPDVGFRCVLNILTAAEAEKAEKAAGKSKSGEKSDKKKKGSGL